MARDTSQFVAACSVSARGKSSHHSPAGLLRPLSIPSQPCCHIVMDFITSLPPSKGNTVNLNIIDRFSKFVNYLPLPKLPSDLETASLLIKNVFKAHGIPCDIVSDRRPQFASQVWHKFYKSVSATASPSSGYHPQTTNQDLKAVLQCFTAHHPVLWSSHLPWI